MTRFGSLLETVKRYWYRYVLITLLLSLVAGIWLEWREEQALAVSRLETHYESVKAKQLQWLNFASVISSEAAQVGASYPEKEALAPLYDAAKLTLDTMTAFYTPTGEIEKSAREYRDALLDVAGAINQYSPDEESMRRLLEANQVAANLGGELQVDVDQYRTDAWRSFLSVIF